MNEFLHDIHTRFGVEAAMVAEMWLNFYVYGTREDYGDAYTNFVKTQMNILIRHTGMTAPVFNTIVNESKSFLQKYVQTVH